MVQRIAIIVIFLSFFLAIISLCVLQGFKSSIKKKIFSFSAHIIINKYDAQKSYEEAPFFMDKKSFFYKYLMNNTNVANVQEVAHKPALLKTKEDVHGIIFKGVRAEYEQTEFKSNIKQGAFPHFEDSVISKNIVISQKMADKLQIKVGDSLLLYFVQNPPRFRKVVIGGIYETGLEELDEYFVLGDLKLLQQLNAWKPYEIGALEIYLTDFNRIDSLSNDVYNSMDYDMQLQTVTDKYLQLFDWLDILNRNVTVFLVLLFMVSGFVISATLIVMILERTPMVGLFKALGMYSSEIRWIFILNGLEIILKGMLAGVGAGLLFCWLQMEFQFIPLNAENYYMNTVPIEFPWVPLGIIVAGFFVLLLLITFLPTFFITRLTPVKSIKFN
ncbi:MAG: FtsX-like permease family protein [Cytophagaceae bacterium]